ncbi:MAG: DUF4124 domain-containing protein [Pseudomonadota bacterium]|nr:DUF4124 domain-containing protein [Pseudomonadota bacterium]MDP1903415.1 DUF4124 domain-containing protein [Pseudomonadota bacterium]MDP2352385.1 DUF4124 domain-containing protein [Pseudomonadota bacterium]
MFRPGMILVLSTLATAAGADVYKWTDAQGKVNYGDRPPSITTAMPPNLQASEAAEARASAARRQAADQAARKRLEAAKAKETESRDQATRAEENQRRAENCQRARGNLELLQRAHMRLTTVDARGQSRVLDTAARQTEVDRAQRMISENCAN